MVGCLLPEKVNDIHKITKEKAIQSRGSINDRCKRFDNAMHNLITRKGYETFFFTQSFPVSFKGDFLKNLSEER